MERPERPSRHSKSHDKWKRIIEPAGDSDSSSDWSTGSVHNMDSIDLTTTSSDSNSSNLSDSEDEISELFRLAVGSVEGVELRSNIESSRPMSDSSDISSHSIRPNESSLIVAAQPASIPPESICNIISMEVDTSSSNEGNPVRPSPTPALCLRQFRQSVIEGCTLPAQSPALPLRHTRRSVLGRRDQSPVYVSYLHSPRPKPPLNFHSDPTSAPRATRGPSYYSQPAEQATSSSAHPQTSSSTAQIATERRDRLISMLPNYSSLLARYGNNNKRSLDAGDSPSSHNYHLLHHDYAERDSFRSLPGDGCPWFLRPNSAVKRPRLSRLTLPNNNNNNNNNSDYAGDAGQDASNREDADSADLLYPLSISSGNNRSPAAANAGDAAAEENSDVAPDGETAGTSSATVKRSLSEHTYMSDIFDWDPPRYSSHRLINPFTKITKRPLGVGSALNDRHPLNLARGTGEDASDVQVILMAGPSTSTSATLQRTSRKPFAERLSALVAASEEVIIVDDHQVTEVQSDPVDAGTVEELPPTTLEPKPRTSLDEETLNQGLIGLLECPVCMEYMAPPIHQCRRGHLVCVNCKPKLPLCPTCRSRLTDSRNLAMEKVADKLLYPCKNAHVSCVAQLRLKDKVEHEANCDHRTYRCSLPLCDWKGFKDELLPHNTTKHADKLLFGNKQVLVLRLGDLTTATNQNWIVSTLDELFRVNMVTLKIGQRLFETGTCRMQVFGCVQYVGPQNKAGSYEYTLETRKTTDQGKRCITFTRDCHKDLVKCAMNYSAGDSFYLRGDTAELLSEGTQGDVVLMVHLNIQANKKERAPVEEQA